MRYRNLELINSENVQVYEEKKEFYKETVARATLWPLSLLGLFQIKKLI